MAEHHETAGTPARKERRQREQDARWARKLERAEDLDHLLLWLRTQDARVLRSMLYACDRGCAKVRATVASLALSLEEGHALLARVQVWLDQLEGIAYSGRLDGAAAGWSAGVELAQADAPLTPRQKQALRAYRREIAAQPGSDFYLPRSPEGRRFAQLLVALDGTLIRARAADTLDQAAALLARVGHVIREGHAVVSELAAAVKIEYEPHPLFKRARKAEQASGAPTDAAMAVMAAPTGVDL